jgi:apolipoprotein N-acyltransferase
MPTTDRIRWGAIQHDHHELLQRLRAVESGRWLLRAASSGRTETIDPHGVPSIEGLDFAEEGIIVLPFGHLSERTIGSRLALFGPLALAATGVYLVLTMIGRFRRRLRE